MAFKTILFGQLDFGNAKSFERVSDMSMQRAEVYYRNEVLIDLENVFDPDQLSLLMEKKSYTHEYDKIWRNTINLIKHATQFAVSGRVYAWLLEDRKVVKEMVLEPDNDHGAVRHYRRACSLKNREENAQEAIEVLNYAIEAHEGHAQALQARAELWSSKGKTEKAIADYSRSIQWSPTLPDAYLGRAALYLESEQYEEAIMDLTSAVKFGIPHQSFYWEARRMKADCFMHLEDYKNAESEWRLLSRRNFSEAEVAEGVPAYIAHQYSLTLLENGKPEDAIRTLEPFVKGEISADSFTPKADLLFVRGLALKQAGRKGFRSALKEAADAGSEQAADMLMTTT